MAYNELGKTKLPVAEPRRGVSVGASSCRARSVTEGNLPQAERGRESRSDASLPQLCEVFSFNRRKVF